MRFPNHDGLPLWLFILVILLASTTLALVAYVVWRKCIKQPRKVEPSSASEFEPSDCRFYLRKRQIARSSWMSPAARRNNCGPNRGHSQFYSPQCPEKAHHSGRDDNPEMMGYRYSVRDLASCEKSPNHNPRRSLSDMLRRHHSVTLNRSAALPSHEEIRASYISDHSIDATRNIDEIDSKRTISAMEPPRLDYPALLSPLTPLTLPRNPQHHPLHPTAFQSLSKYASIPPLPAPCRLSRYSAGIRSMKKRKERDSRSLCPRLSSSPCDLTQSHPCRPPTVTRESFLQAWSNASHGWVQQPEAPLYIPLSSSESTEPKGKKAPQVDLVSISDAQSQISDEHEMEVSLPSCTPITSNSPVSRTQSVGERSTRSDRKQMGRNLSEDSRTKGEQISWLTDK